MNSPRKGTLDQVYAQGREKKRALRYRLQRRTCEVIAAIREFAPHPINRIVDLGTADGRMVASIQEAYPDAGCLGIEYNEDLVNIGAQLFPHVLFVQGDIQTLALGDRCCDVAVATAVLEHVPDPEKALHQIKRILRPGGIAVITSPDPFWERLATLTGHLKNDQHHQVMNLHQLKKLANSAGFTVLKARKFMLSPIGLPGEFFIESVIYFVKLHVLLANQLLILRS